MNVRFDFNHQNFLVTGASSGIGRETARELLQAGANVMGMARHFPENDELAIDYEEQWVPVPADVTHFDELESHISCFVEKYGKFSGCVHSAGMAMLLPINVWNYEASKKIMDINLWAAEALLKLFWKRKYREEHMSHVFISSVSAHSGQKGLSGYAASKAALEALVRTAARELGPKCNVNSVCLGWIDTNMTKLSYAESMEVPMGTDGTVVDAANMILYLLSDNAHWITGSNFVVDGGYLS